MSGTGGGSTQDSAASPQRLPLLDERTRAAISVKKSNWMDAFAGTLLIQCDAAEALEASVLVVDRPGAGLVLAGSGALAAARALREHGFEKPLLCDAARYKGNRRYPASEPFDEQWILSQRKLDLLVLTDSGYVGKGDVAGLRSILARARELGEGVIACLPLHISWLADGVWLTVLEEEILASGVVVALVLEHKNDPLGVQKVLRGLLTSLASGSPVLLLRSDVSAVGALCFGALAAAAGTTSGLRHLYPVSDENTAPRPAQVSVLIEHCLSYVGTDKVATAVQLTPDQVERWECDCHTCNGRMMDHFATVLDRGKKQAAAFSHSLEILLNVHERLRFSSLTPYQRRNSWVEQCSVAGFYHLDIGRSVGGNWTIPRFLTSWQVVGAEFLAREGATQELPHG
ncbi:hypothetical protein AB0L13_47220 [Saccharopolyspora shandongensis]|uniref:hypothetical protein n=1 Tax=Saccharopolyspora shandongensis TaxID=418495 RepID=UPI003429BA32